MKRWWSWLKAHRRMTIPIAIILVIFLIIFGAKLYLWINFIIGYDLVLKLSTDKEVFSITRNHPDTVTITASVATNPFCKALCSSNFQDVSHNRTLDRSSFPLRPGSPFEKSYIIAVEQTGSGLLLYRFNLQCHSERSVLCHTGGQPITRSIIIIAQQNLTAGEQELQRSLHRQLESFVIDIYSMEQQSAVVEENIQQLSAVVSTTRESTELLQVQEAIKDITEKVKSLEPAWAAQQYAELERETAFLKDRITSTVEALAALNESVYRSYQSYNLLSEKLEQTRLILERVLSPLPLYLNASQERELNDTSSNFNAIVTLLSTIPTLEARQALANMTFNSVQLFQQKLNAEQRRDAVELALQIRLQEDLLCSVIGECVHRRSLIDIANGSLNHSAVCQDAGLVRENASLLNSSYFVQIMAYPNTTVFWGNISSKVQNLYQERVRDYLKTMPRNLPDSALLLEFLHRAPFIPTEEYPGNLTAALIYEILRQTPDYCPTSTASVLITSTSSISIPRHPLALTDSNRTLPTLTVSFEEPEPQCCIYGNCKPCCLAPLCRTVQETYPIVFVHGHAVNKETSFEFSLEGFNKLQQRLEQDGYLNAGAITLYTARDTPPGLWGAFSVPFSIRASYYFDLFGQPENYVVVQTKSENIDTYAVRLKEVIDTVKYKTGKDKVNLIAFSMGGLVTRRYAQVFGDESIHTLILIGTPHKGIVGDVADYCDVTGEARECQDLNAESLFINKLNRGSLPSVPVYNIVGVGCPMNGETGDGTVLKSHAVLPGAQNFYINGTCRSALRPLHLDLLDVPAYPQVYEIVRAALKE